MGGENIPETYLVNFKKFRMSKKKSFGTGLVFDDDTSDSEDEIETFRLVKF